MLYMFIICINYLIQTSTDLINENGFTLKIADADVIQKKL